MARNAGNTLENGLVQGLITEATGINFPEKAVADCWNVRFEKTGNITRRLGYAYEDGVVNIAGAPGEAGVCKSFLWKAVGKDGNRTFLVIQAGGIISFYEPDANGNFSSGLKPFSVNLYSYGTGIGGLNIAYAEAGISAGNGKLFINHPFCEPVYVVYNDESDTITVTSYQIQIRDMDGVNDGLGPGVRPSTLTNLHKYNLYNQGWDQPKVKGPNDSKNYPLNIWKQILGVYPSNADVWWYAKGVNHDGKEGLFGTTVRLVSKTTGYAPKGHYIFNAFDMNRTSVSGISGLPSRTSEGYRPSVCAFYAGRIFYAGVPHPDYQGKVYYTQIVEGDQNIGRCYQANDPTSEQLSDLLDTDGGEIKVTGMGRVSFMVDAGNSLFLFANNGIWAIGGSGAEGTGFTATDFSVRKVSSIGTESSSSFVNAEGTPVWWNYDGIWMLGQDGPESLTNNTIKTFMQNTIPGISKKYVQGAFNPLERTIQWLWKSEEPASVPLAYKYDRILEFNVETKAFYPMQWNVADQPFSTIFCATDIQATTTESQNVTDSTLANVTNSAAAVVTADVVIGEAYKSSQFKYFATNL